MASSVKKVLFYHIYLTEDSTWVTMFLEQFNIIISSGLYDELETIFVSAIVSDDSLQKISELSSFIADNFGKKIILFWIKKDYQDNELTIIDKSSKIITEEFCLKKLWDYSHSIDDNQYVGYIHAKGMTSYKRFLDTSEVEYNPKRLVKYYFWRKFLEWGVIEKYKECWESLRSFDVSGVNRCEWPTPHYSGGFWWSNSKYIRTLDDPSNDKWWIDYRKNNPVLLDMAYRIKDEMWIGSKNPKMFSLYDHAIPPPKGNLGDILIKRSEYASE